MSFVLVYGDHEAALPLNFSSTVEGRLMELLFETNYDGTARADLERQLVDLVTALVDAPRSAPTQKQIKYAVAIARTLSIELPAGALISRNAMSDFLNRYAAAYRLHLKRVREVLAAETSQQSVSKSAPQ